MCGIIGITSKDAGVIRSLVDGLYRLEYRGYDSAGVFLSDGTCVRSVGKVSQLAAHIEARRVHKNPSCSGVAHTRWATHGEVTEANAHPHLDCTKRIAVVHNGVIENWRELRDELEKQGHAFASETDSEVLAHLIEREYKRNESLCTAVEAALSCVRGAYGIAVVHLDCPEILIAACAGSPLIIGITEQARLVASDPIALAAHTASMIWMEDGDIAVLEPHAHAIVRLNGGHVVRKEQQVHLSEQELDRGEYRHYMLKEIMQIPEVLRVCMAGRNKSKDGLVWLGGLERVKDWLYELERVVFTGCGTAYYAAQFGAYFFETLAGIPTEVVLASEFADRVSVLRHAAVVAVSQSGETKDTCDALEEAKRRGALALGVVNTANSRLTRITHAGVHMRAGQESAVASTKAFFAPVAILLMMAVQLGRMRGLPHQTAVQILTDLAATPDILERMLSKEWRAYVQEKAAVLSKYENALYLGRGLHYPAACEGALKIKEVSYIHAEGYAAGEMKHGPLALVNESFPSVIVVPQGPAREKTLTSLAEIRARKGPVFAIATEGDTEVEQQADHTIFVPRVPHPLMDVFVVTTALDLLAYYAGVARGCDVDQPRNLAKAVTTE